jgi:hypothetical protein
MRNARFFATQNGRPDARSEFAVPVGFNWHEKRKLFRHSKWQA